MIQHNKHHLLHYILPAPSAASQCYNLLRRPHTQLLPQHRGHLMDSNFITRILYKNIYWRYYETIYTYTESMTNWYYTASFYHCCNHLAFCQAWSLNEYVVMLCYDGTLRFKERTFYIALQANSSTMTILSCLAAAHCCTRQKVLTPFHNKWIYLWSLLPCRD